MTDYASLASRLLDAADKPSDHAGNREVLAEAISAIDELRTIIGRRPASSVRDASGFLEDVANSLAAGRSRPSEVRTALLDAAAMIRDLELRSLDKGLLRSVDN